MFLASFASMYVFILCFDTGCFEVLLWVLQPSVVGDPLLSFKETDEFHLHEIRKGFGENMFNTILKHERCFSDI